jgi:hypothetical protein
MSGMSQKIWKKARMTSPRIERSSSPSSRRGDLDLAEIPRSYLRITNRPVIDPSAASTR